MLSSGDDRLCQSSSSVGLERVANAGVDDPALVQTVAEAIFNIDKPKGIINNFGLSPEANVVPASLVVDGGVISSTLRCHVKGRDLLFA